jgi:hypothetical protein
VIDEAISLVSELPLFFFSKRKLFLTKLDLAKINGVVITINDDVYLTTIPTVAW